MKRCLKQKHNDVGQEFHESHRAWYAKPLTRRRFLQRMGALSTGMLLPALNIEAIAGGDTPVFNEPWLTLDAVQRHLFPSEKNSPGAHEINAIGYLRTLLDTPGFDAEEKTFILNGPGWLNQLAQQQYQKPFHNLDFERAEKLLRQIAASQAGENWLSTLLMYIFEALLSSPVYGGNPDGIGWAWLEHDPGFPQPGAAQTWMRLKKKS